MIPSSRSIYYHSLNEKPRLFNRNGIEVEVQIEKVENTERVTCTSADNDIEVCNMSLLCPASNDAIDAVAYQSYYQVCRVGDKDYFHCALCNAFEDNNLLKEDVTKRKLRKPLAYSISNVVTHMKSSHFEWLKLSKVLQVQSEILQDKKILRAVVKSN